MAGGEAPDFRRLALGLALCTDATVGDDESVIGDPTEAAFVVLAAKMGVDAAQTRAALPRRAEVPFDSEYKFMATFHDRPQSLTAGMLRQPHFMCVKGAPDVVLERCGTVLWHGSPGPGRHRARRDHSRPTASCRSAGSGCSRSPPGTWTTRRWRQP